MRVLAEKPELRYLQVIFDDEGVDTFQQRLIKSGSFAGRPVKLSDGRRVGVCLSGAAWPFPFEADGDQFDGAAVVEMQFDSSEFMKVAREADLTLEEDAVVLLGDGAGDRDDEPTKKSRGASLSDELRRGWRLA